MAKQTPTAPLPFPTQASGGMCWLFFIHRVLPVLHTQCSGFSLQFSVFHFNTDPSASLLDTSPVFSC